MASSSNKQDPTGSSPTPMLRVMRLQQPELHQNSQSQALCLPDSLVVMVGEIFTAYLGVLNGSSDNAPIRNLKVVSQLQTPSTRHSLPNLEAPVLLGNNSRIDHIISQNITEPGQHILRVEVHYEDQTFRKFYRFQVKHPISVATKVMRLGEQKCFVQARVKVQDATLLIPSVTLETVDGLKSERVHSKCPGSSALELYDSIDTLSDGDEKLYLFQITVETEERKLRGIAGGDTLGKISVNWRKAMGESGTIYGEDVVCPSSLPKIMHQSGFSVDVAAAASTPGAVLPSLVTVEPIDPPSTLYLFQPTELQFLIVNHSSQSLHLQVQFRNQHVCGSSFINIGELQGNGGSKLAKATIMAKSAGLIKFDSCTVVDLVSRMEMAQPALFCAFVEASEPPIMDETTEVSLTA